MYRTSGCVARAASFLQHSQLVPAFVRLRGRLWTARWKLAPIRSSSITTSEARMSTTILIKNITISIKPYMPVLFNRCYNTIIKHFTTSPNIVHTPTDMIIFVPVNSMSNTIAVNRVVFTIWMNVNSAIVVMSEISHLVNSAKNTMSAKIFATRVMPATYEETMI